VRNICKNLAGSFLMSGLLLCLGCGDHSGGGPSASESPPPTQQKTPDRRPNVLFVVIDTLRADRLGCYGYTRNTSPNIDRVAAHSVVFDRAFANSDGTVLSHISLLSSRYTAPREQGPAPSKTLAEAFSEAGYATFGIAANPALTPTLGWGRGFDRYTDQPVDDATLTRMRDDTNFSHQIEVRSADQTTDFVLKPLRRHFREQPEKPWFLFVNYLDPHDPYTERLPWSDEFHESASDISGTLRTGDGHTIWSWNARTRPTLTIDDLRRLEELYDAEVRFADTHLQRVFEYLRETGQDRNTVVLITSDHGEVFEEHALMTHMLACYDTEIKVPLIISVPWLTESQVRSSELVESVDIGPTLLTLCGIPVPPSFQGRALIDAHGRLLRTGRSYTRHTHRAVNGKQRRELNFPLESAVDSVVLRFADSKIYFLATGGLLVFDISDYPSRTRVTGFDQIVPLLNRNDRAALPEPSELPPEARKAFKALGYAE
jgi:arylsulfatase A-like enzyme